MSSIISVQQSLQHLNNETARANFNKGRESLGSSEIGRDGFMQLMLAQLRHQNPLEPLDSTQQLAQQAAFSQIEELQKLNETVSFSNQLGSAGQMVGRNIEYLDGSGQVQNGFVDSILIANGEVGLQIGDKTITAAQVTKVKAGS